MQIKYLVCFFYFLLCFAALAQPVIDNKQDIIDLGELKFGEVIEKTVKVKNSGTDVLRIKKVRPSCECMSASVMKAEAEVGEFCEISFNFDTTKKVKSKFKKYLYLQSNDPNKPLSRMTVIGTIEKVAAKEALVKLPIASSQASTVTETINTDILKVLFFYSDDCQSCLKVQRFLEKLDRKNKGKIVIEKYNILNEDNYLKLVSLEEIYQVEENHPMIIFVGEKYFSGKKNIMSKLDGYLNSLLENGKYIAVKTIADNSKKVKVKVIERFKKFSPLLILMAGLIDGINPCAFVTIVFLVSFLSFSKKSNKHILISGACFISGVFIAYLLIGLSLREILNHLINLDVVFKYVYFFVVAVLFVLTIFSLYDAYVYLKYKNSQKIILKLPSLLKKKIHALIRKTVEAKYFLGAVFIAGFLISILESVCTGQVYLPTILFVLKDSILKWNSFFYLVLYNIAFIIPLFCIVLVSCFGVAYVTKFSQKNTGIAKVLLAVLFAVLMFSLIAAW